MPAFEAAVAAAAVIGALTAALLEWANGPRRRADGRRRYGRAGAAGNPAGAMSMSTVTIRVRTRSPGASATSRRLLGSTWKSGPGRLSRWSVSTGQ